MYKNYFSKLDRNQKFEQLILIELVLLIFRLNNEISIFTTSSDCGGYFCKELILPLISDSSFLYSQFYVF